MAAPLLIAMLTGLAPSLPALAATLYAVPDKEGPGTDKAQPSGKLCALIEQAKDGDTIQLAEGTYALAQPCHVSKRRLSLLGGWKADFSTRDPFMSISRLTSSGSALLRADGGADDFLVEGVMFDGGSSAAYTGTLCPDCLAAGYDAKAHQPLVLLEQSGRVRFRSVVFANAPGGAILANVRSALTLEGVSVVNARPFAVRVGGACGYAAPRCVELLVRGSTFVWSWRETPANDSPGGSAIVVSSGVSARIEKTVLAYADRAGVELDSDEHTELGMQQVVTFDNKKGDVMIGGKGMPITEVTGLSGAPPFGRIERLALPWDIDYLNRYLARGKERFYGVRLPANRVFMLSPASEAGLKTPAGSRLSYEAAVAGNVTSAHVVPPPQASPPPPVEDDKKKKKKAKKGKK